MATAVAANAAIAFRLRPRLGGPDSGQPDPGALPRAARVEVRADHGRSSAVLVGLFAGGSASGQVFDYLAWRNATPVQRQRTRSSASTSPSSSSATRGGGSRCRSRSPPWWLSVIAAAIVHYTMGGLRLQRPRRGGSRGRPGPPVDPDRAGGDRAAASATGSTSTAWRSPHQPAVHRHHLHRRQRHRHRQDDLGDHRRHLWRCCSSPTRCCGAGRCRPSGWSCCCCPRSCSAWSTRAPCSTSASGPSEPRPGAPLHRHATSPPPGRRTGWTRWRSPTTRPRPPRPPGQLKADAEALPGIRLIDPNVVGPAFEQLQQVRGYYSFPKHPRRRPLHHRRQGDRRGGRGPGDGPARASRARTGTT